MSKRYNHAFTVAFAVANSSHEKGEDVTEEEILKAMWLRIQELKTSGETLEAVGLPYDTYEETT